MKDSNWNEKKKKGSTGIGVLRLIAKHKEYSTDNFLLLFLQNLGLAVVKMSAATIILSQLQYCYWSNQYSLNDSKRLSLVPEYAWIILIL